MESYSYWYLVVGPLLLGIAFMGTRVARWPVTTAMIYLIIGVGLGLFGWLQFDLGRQARTLQIASEVAVIVSLFSAGLRLRLPFRARSWRLPLALASIGMALTVALLAAVGVVALGLPLGVAVVLAAILAPTDPVLAADVQVEDSSDQDPVRLTLTAEAGLNDGTAFPFLLLGLGLLGMHELGPGFSRWLAIDVLWQVGAGLAVGAGIGWATTKAVIYLRRSKGEAFGFDDFLALGIIGTTYGVAELLHVYGFLAVFAAGWALRGVERRDSQRMATTGDAALPAESSKQAEQGPQGMAEAVLNFNSQMDRIGELALMLLTGALLVTVGPSWSGVLIAATLFLVIRPISIGALCRMRRMDATQTALTCWFGIRGIGSLFYLSYAFTHGLPEPWREPLAGIVLTVIALSTILHGLTSTPMMRRYARLSDGKRVYDRRRTD